VVLTFEELAIYRGKVTMVDGGFDPLHAGHIEYFQKARALGRPLLCNLADDDYIGTKHAVLLPSDQRVAVIDALRDIAYTHMSDHTTEDVLRQLQPFAYVKGKDWEWRLPAEQVRICQRWGIRIAYVETVAESSTRLLTAATRPAHVGASVGES
jgi:bifunctional ADP-heptose synthase (sugar kinase/adenylyltransferase)